MFDGNSCKPIEIIDSKLSTSLNHITWSLANVKETDLSKVQQKRLRRALINTQEGLEKALAIIDAYVSLID